MTAQAAGEAIGVGLVLSAFVFSSRAWLALVAVVMLAAAASDAAAQVVPEGLIVSNVSAGGRVVNMVSSANGTWVPMTHAPGSSALVTVGKDFSMGGPGGRAAAATMRLGLSAGQVALAAARAAGYVGAAVWVGTELYDYWKDLRVQPDASGSGVVGFDAGTSQVTGSVFTAYANTYGGDCATSGSTIQSAHSDFVTCAVAKIRTSYPAYNTNYEGSFTCTGLTCSGGSIVTRYTGSGTVYVSSGAGNTYVQTSDLQCPAWVDFYGNSLGVGSSQPGADGKCPTGTYAPITPAELAAIRDANAGAGDIDLNELMAEILGKVPLPITSDSNVEVGNVIPSSLVGPEKVTTSVEAGETVTTTEAIGWDWSRDPLRKTEGNWIETKSEITRDSAGNVIRSTTTSTAGKTDTEAAAESGDMCKTNPNSAACATFGDPGTAASLPTVALPASMDERITFGADTAECPADRAMETALAGTLYFSWEGPCMFADGIRPIVVGLAYLAAVLSFFGFAKGND